MLSDSNLLYMQSQRDKITACSHAVQAMPVRSASLLMHAFLREFDVCGVSKSKIKLNWSVGSPFPKIFTSLKQSY